MSEGRMYIWLSKIAALNSALKVTNVNINTWSSQINNEIDQFQKR